MDKKCSVCKEVKPNSEFSKKGIRNGVQRYRSECKKCYTALSRKYGGKRFQLYKTRHPEQYAAGIKLRHAVKNGIISKPESCTICGKNVPKEKIQAHHSDYSKPLMVAWVCSRCHVDIHRMLKVNN
jgi:hypothetical protein